MKKMVHTKQKLTALILALCMALTVFAGMGTAAVHAATSGWDGTADQTWYNAGGNTFTIDNAAELAGLAKLVNGGNDFSGKTVRLGNDISLSTKEWTPIGNSGQAFAGTFNGNGHTISGLSIAAAANGFAGLFGNNTGTIKSFTVAGTVGTIAAGKDNIAAAVGFNDGTVLGITNQAAVTVNTSSIYAVGGVVGQNGEHGTVKECLNSAKIEGTKCVGGIVGRSYNTVTDCANTGEILGNGGGKDGIGGIVGISGNKSSKYTTMVSDSYNTGKVSNSGGRWHGGIVGMNDSTGTVKNSYSIGELVKGYSSNWHPIVGHREGKVIDCYSLSGLNTGNDDPATGIVKTEQEMKSGGMLALLGAAFTADIENINSGYPILNWQISSGAKLALTAVEKIKAIGKVTLKSGSVIKAARAAYNAVPSTQKLLVTNASALTAAEKAFNKLSAPTAIKGVKAVSKSYNSISVTWKKNPVAKSYSVYRAATKNGSYKKLTTTTKTSYTDKKLKTGKTYYYKVRAYGKSLENKTLTGAYSARVAAKPVPAKASLSLKSGKRAVTAKWSKVSGATKYELFRANSKTGKYIKTRLTVKQSYKDTKLKAGKRYYYKVRSYKTVSGKKIYSSYSTVKSIKAK